MMHLRPGQSASRLRNVGISRARAPYVAFIEPYDVLTRHMLSRAVCGLDRNPEAGLAFSDAEYIGDDGKTTRRSAIFAFQSLHALASPPFENHWQLIKGEHLARGLLDGNLTSVSGLVLRRQLLTAIGPFDERLADWSEFDLWFRLAHSCDALYLSEVAVCSQKTRTSMPLREIDGCLIALQRERNRWIDRTARHQVNRRIAQCLGTVGCEERKRGYHLRSSAMFAFACAVSGEIHWVREILRSILSALLFRRDGCPATRRWSAR
jgi:hypothetical protein